MSFLTTCALNDKGALLFNLERTSWIIQHSGPYQFFDIFHSFTMSLQLTKIYICFSNSFFISNTWRMTTHHTLLGGNRTITSPELSLDTVFWHMGQVNLFRNAFSSSSAPGQNYSINAFTNCSLFLANIEIGLSRS